jgi:hypothetical protein
MAATGAARSTIPAPGKSLLAIDLRAPTDLEGLLGQLPDSDTAGLTIERQGNSFELIHSSPEQLLSIGQAALKQAKIKAPAKATTNATTHISASEVFENISPLHATSINRSRRGNMVAGGDTLLSAQCENPVLVGKLFNDIEKKFPKVSLVNIDAKSGTILLSAPADDLKAIVKAFAK